MSEENNYIDIKINPVVLSLFYLSSICKIDLVTLVLLFEKLGDKMSYLFYLMSKKKFTFPSEGNLIKAINFSNTYRILNNKNLSKSSISEKDLYIFNELKSKIINNKFIRVNIDSDISNEPLEVKREKRVRTVSDKNELHSIIKKYIRKERRKLQKIGKIDKLLDLSSTESINIINKVKNLIKNKITDGDTNVDNLISDILVSYNKKYMGDIVSA